jgi:hypothetical protein
MYVPIYEVYSYDSKRGVVGTFNSFESAVAVWKDNMDFFTIKCIWPTSAKNRSKELNTIGAINEYRNLLNQWAIEDGDDEWEVDQLMKYLRENSPFEDVKPDNFNPNYQSAINPSHYQGYVMDLQWLETMQYLPSFRDPSCFKAAVELQVRKYLDRLGGKDAEQQELGKALWYLKFLLAYIKNNNQPIRVKDIEKLLNE